MESRIRIFYSFLLIVVMFGIFTVSPWYFVRKEPFYVNYENKIKYSDLEAEKRFKNYSSKRDYFVSKEYNVLFTKSLIPFYYNKSEQKVIKLFEFSTEKR